MENILMTVFNGTKPRYTTYQFTEMVNVGLVLAGVKKGALIYLDEHSIKILQNAGLSVSPYPIVPELKLVIVSKNNPGLNEKSTHVDVGKALSYMTPIDINKSSNSANSKFVDISITFRRGNGRKLESHLMEQKVINKTERQIQNYITPFVNAIKEMKLPEEFHIYDVKVEIASS